MDRICYVNLHCLKNPIVTSITDIVVTVPIFGWYLRFKTICLTTTGLQFKEQPGHLAWRIILGFLSPSGPSMSVVNGHSFVFTIGLIVFIADKSLGRPSMTT